MRAKRDKIFKWRDYKSQHLRKLSKSPLATLPTSMTAITGEHYPHHADSTNTLDLSAVDDVHPTPSVVNGSNARPPHCPTVGPPAFSRRADSENTPPSARLATSKVRNGIQAAASHRRRAHATGGAHHPWYAVAHSKQKSSSRSPASINIDMPRTSPTGIEMSDATNAITMTSVSLPRYLARPAFRPLPKEAIAAAAPELADTPLNYIHDGLQCLGPE